MVSSRRVKGSGIMDCRATALNLAAAWVLAMTSAHAAAPVVANVLQPGQMVVGTAPAWIGEVVVPDGPAGVDEASDDTGPDTGDGVAYLLVDSRVDVGSGTDYYRSVRLVTATHALESVARVDVDFDPAYQRLVWHRLDVRRGGNVVSRLNLDDIEVTHRYEDLEYSIYDGSVSAFTLLEDLRVGDVVDLEYSVVGFNPVFGDRFGGMAYLSWAVPVRRMVCEYRSPTSRPLRWKTWMGAPDPDVVESPEAGVTSLRWTVDDVAAAEFDYDVPPEWDPRMRIQVSEYQSWGEVVAWALPLYPEVDLSDEDWNTIPEGVRVSADDPLASAEALLQFVQEDIRYLTVAVGESSHRPSDPRVTLPRRFGDCKDKAYLYCEMLRRFGLRAVPALVDTDWCNGIGDMLPMPTVFDHVIVRIDLPDGTQCWVDPTRSNQGGPLRARVVGDYGFALPIASGSDALQGVERAPETADITEIEETFNLGPVSEPAELTVTTVYRGAAADRMRRSFLESRRDELSRGFVGFYTNDYPEVEETKPFTVLDDRANNRIMLNEHYRIDRFWVPEDDEGEFVGSFWPQMVRDALERPSKTRRAGPFEINHPVRVSQSTTIKLPEGWPAWEDDGRVANRNMAVETRARVQGSTFTYSASYESLHRIVPAKDVPDFARDVDRAMRELGYELTWTPDTDDENVQNARSTKAPVSTPDLLWGRVVAAPLLAGTTMLAWLIALLIPRRGPPVPPNPEVATGMGGWMVVALILVVVRWIGSFFLYGIQGTAYFTPDGWAGIMAGENGALVAAALHLRFLFEPILFVSLPMLSVLLFGRRRLARRAAIMLAAIIATMAVVSIATLWEGPPASPREAGRLFGWMIGLGVWLALVAYFLISKRMANTFRR